jgi:hypothetical protein
MTPFQKTIAWWLSLTLTIIICGYGICLIERGVHRMMGKQEMCVEVKNMTMDPLPHGDKEKSDSTGHAGMMGKDCCKDSAHAGHAGMMPGECGKEGMHGKSECGMKPGCDGHRGMDGCMMHGECGEHRGMGCCEGHMGMRRPMGPPPFAGHALTAMIGAFVLLVGGVFGIATLRPRAEKS